MDEDQGLVKRVLLVYDVYGWAWHRIAVGLQSHAPRGVTVDLASQVEFEATSQDRDALASYDAVLHFSATELPTDVGYSTRLCTVLGHAGLMYDDRSLSLRAICSTTKMRNARVSQELLNMEHISGFLCLNEELADFASSVRPRGVYYTPAGVDTSLFRKSCSVTHDARKPLVVGWCGQRSNRHNTKGQYVRDLVMQSLGGITAWKLNESSHQRCLSEEDMVKFYNSVDVFLCTSITEGAPLPPIEAMACGRPVVTTAVGDMPRLVDHNVNGFLVDDYDDEESAISAAEMASFYLLSYAKDRTMLEQHSQAALETAMSHRDWSIMSDRWYKAILGE